MPLFTEEAEHIDIRILTCSKLTLHLLVEGESSHSEKLLIVRICILVIYKNSIKFDTMSIDRHILSYSMHLC